MPGMWFIIFSHFFNCTLSEMNAILLCIVKFLKFASLIEPNPCGELNLFPKLHSKSNISIFFQLVKPEKQTKQNPLGTG